MGGSGCPSFAHGSALRGQRNPAVGRLPPRQAARVLHSAEWSSTQHPSPGISSELKEKIFKASVHRETRQGWPGRFLPQPAPGGWAGLPRALVRKVERQGRRRATKRQEPVPEMIFCECSVERPPLSRAPLLVSAMPSFSAGSGVDKPYDLWNAAKGAFREAWGGGIPSPLSVSRIARSAPGQ